MPRQCNAVLTAIQLIKCKQNCEPDSKVLKEHNSPWIWHY